VGTGKARHSVIIALDRDEETLAAAARPEAVTLLGWASWGWRTPVLECSFDLDTARNTRAIPTACPPPIADAVTLPQRRRASNYRFTHAKWIRVSRARLRRANRDTPATRPAPVTSSSCCTSAGGDDVAARRTPAAAERDQMVDRERAMPDSAAAAKSRVASWVLSPSSARNTLRKTVR
jgi:hypothetical protein